ncbi:PTS lactose transporter subunit IIBC [Sporolactobacillus sp. CPB3-1]|uniref:PTS system lactose-specific EIICB component n=1 Tax=Sporolactobacillus mangiferae TaxID=2940498 RepID=A0ABT0M9C2_9BACL|nr:PTS lactose transporter subunit IIBC [Sporolactobacillus mangiferae]MCL1631464.1 PTS lactose transporter subunit IIBC [Sporolactobacillus mangiferae]
MNWLINQLIKMKPTFEKIAANPYLSAIRDGFIAVMPVILFSSLFLLVAFIPNIWGFYWSANVQNYLLKAYNFSMGLLAIFIAATTAKSLTDYKNLSLPKTNPVNPISVIIASEICFFIVAADPLKTGIDISFLGTKGLICAYIIGLIVPNIYYVCIKNNVTIKMPPQVPQNISQTFKDLIPMALSVLAFWLFDIVFRTISHNQNLAQSIITVLSPLFSGTDSYIGLMIIAGAMAFFWFIGIQGPSIVQPAVIAIMLANTDANMKLYQAGEHPWHVFANNTMDYVMNLGGTGSTFVLAYMFLLLAKSRQLKAVGKATFVPVSFSVNEPILFGTPIIMNPVFFIPFILTPMLNVAILKFFVSTLHMSGFIYYLPWTLPAPIGIVMSTRFAVLSFLMVAVMLLIDVLIYYPFMRAYDIQLIAEEAAADAAPAASGQSRVAATDKDAAVADNHETQSGEAKTIDKETNVLVICAGGGTSGILANALNKTASERKLPLNAAARAYGADMDLIQDMDLVILAPQMESMKDNLKNICDKYDTKMVTTSGRQYIELTRDADKALRFVSENI